LIRTDRDDILEAFLALACSLICWRRLRTAGSTVSRSRRASSFFGDYWREQRRSGGRRFPLRALAAS
jgi:hypothetical protein